MQHPRTSQQYELRVLSKMVLKIHRRLYLGQQQATIWHIILMFHSVRVLTLKKQIGHNGAQVTLAQDPEA